MAAMVQLLDRGLIATRAGDPGATCVFALNDAMALGALRALRDRNIDVPGQVSLAGFNDVPATLDTNPTLTPATAARPRPDGGPHRGTISNRDDDPGAADSGVCLGSGGLEPPSDELRVRHVRSGVILRESTAPPAT